MGQKTVRKLTFTTKNMKLLTNIGVKNNIFKSIQLFEEKHLRNCMINQPRKLQESFYRNLKDQISERRVSEKNFATLYI